MILRILVVCLPIAAALQLNCVGTAGHHFVRPTRDILRLGVTTSRDIVSRLGVPTGTSVRITDGDTVKTMTFTYATATVEPCMSTVTSSSSRAAVFNFSEDTLVGYDYTSTFPDDRMTFDESKVSQIKKGESSRLQVEQLLGPPAGEYIHPMAKGEKDHVLLYNWLDIHLSGSSPAIETNTRSKTLSVTLGPDGLVSDVSLSTAKTQR